MPWRRDLRPNRRTGIGCNGPTSPFPGDAATVLKFEANVAMLHVELGGDGLPESLFGVDESLALLRVIIQGGDPEDPPLAVLCHYGPERLHSRILTPTCEAAQPDPGSPTLVATSCGSPWNTRSVICWARRGLDLRSRALISVTIAAVLGTHEPLRGQRRIALNAGVTKDELVELFIHVEAYAGAARAIKGYRIAQAVFAERAEEMGSTHVDQTV